MTWDRKYFLNKREKKAQAVRKKKIHLAILTVRIWVYQKHHKGNEKPQIRRCLQTAGIWVVL